MILIILGVVMLIGLVVLHELGHFIAARRSGVEVEEFGIGFPPKARTITVKNGTEYTLNWLPLGGFVRLKGEHDADKSKGSYGAASLGGKVRIMLAGVVVNLLIAIVIFSGISLFGLPKVFENQFTVASDTEISTQEVLVAQVSDGSAASSAGLEQGDRLVSISSSGCSETACDIKFIETEENLREATQYFAGQSVEITYFDESIEDYQQSLKKSTATLLTSEEVEVSLLTDEPKGYLGVVPFEYQELRATWSAPIVGAVFSGQVIVETFSVFGDIIGDLFQGDASTAKQNVTGVVGIGDVLGELAEQGLKSVMLLVALISLSLAIMNSLPIPALDGGRLFVTLLFRSFRWNLTKEREERIHGTGFALLMLLFVLVTIVDVQRIVGE